MPSGLSAVATVPGGVTVDEVEIVFVDIVSNVYHSQYSVRWDEYAFSVC